jgi:hypothetical protein
LAEFRGYGGALALTNRYHAGMKKSGHWGVQNERVIRICSWPPKAITGSAPPIAPRLVHATKSFVFNAMMKQGRVGMRLGFDGIGDLESGHIFKFGPCISYCGSKM